MIRLIIYAAWILFYIAIFGGIGIVTGGALGWLADSMGIGNSSNLSSLELGASTGMIAGAVVGFAIGITRFSQRIRVLVLVLTALIGATVFLFSGRTLAEDSPWLLGLATAIGAFIVMLIMSPESRSSLRSVAICIGLCALVGGVVGVALGWGKYAGSNDFLTSAWTGMTLGLVPGTIVGLVVAWTRDNRRMMIFTLAAVAIIDFGVSIYIIYSRVGESGKITPFFGVDWPSDILALVLPIGIYWAAIFALIYVVIQSYRARSSA